MSSSYETVGVIELAHIGFVALGHAGDLEVADVAGGSLADLMARSPSTIWQWYSSICTLTLVAPILGHQRVGLVLAAEEEPRHVAAVDGLQQDLDAMGGSLLGGRSRTFATSVARTVAGSTSSGIRPAIAWMRGHCRAWA